MSVCLIILAAIVCVLIPWIVCTYNSMIDLRNKKDEGWSGIDVQLKRRFDLVPNMVETVKGYARHESETFERVTSARSAIANVGGDSSKARIEAENMMTYALRSLFAVAENYPELKANTNFLQLQEQMAKLEDEIQMARRYYNGSVRKYNTKVQSFPANIIAGHFKFEKAPYFETEEHTKNAPQVKF